jgi:hypothetical protein
VTRQTVIVQWPNPYDPGYNSIGQLVQDSTFVVLGTLGAAIPQPDGSQVDPINVQTSYGYTDPRVELGISSAEFDAANLSVGGTYIFFYASDPVDNIDCIAGGVRGVMAYDASTDTVTRLDQNANSQIPQSQTLEQFIVEVQAAQQAISSQPETNLPPMCSASATGLNG